MGAEVENPFGQDRVTLRPNESFGIGSLKVTNVGDQPAKLLFDYGMPTFLIEEKEEPLDEHGNRIGDGGW